MGICFSSPDEGHKLGTQSQSTVKRTEKSSVNQTTQKPKASSKGHVLGSNNNEKTTTDNEVIDPKEAARRAAQDRFEAKNAKQGKLGQKLQEERNKSSRVHLKEAADQKLNEKSNEQNQLIYD